MKFESDLVTERYAKRTEQDLKWQYSMLNPSVYMSVQERQRKLIEILLKHAVGPVETLKVLEVGCGTGVNLRELITLGLRPENLTGNDLIPDRIERARSLLPVDVTLVLGDAMETSFPYSSFDIVLQSTVFSSILDNDFQRDLANRMWQWLKPGGGIIWYDFVYDNPINPDVRGVKLRRIKELFPYGECLSQRVTLAPPISRKITKIHPKVYTMLNLFPFLRTHLICWISKKL